jgi:hypothetical protein
MYKKRGIVRCVVFFFIFMSTQSFASSEFIKKSAFGDTNIQPEVLALGLKALHCASVKGVNRKADILTIIDYSKPSSEKRMWVLDLKKQSVAMEELVAHGSGSGANLAKKFSNKTNSHQSSIGVFLTGEPYRGKNGLSLRLDGLENGVNDKARRRSIVLHGANYVSDHFVKQYGRLGRSWGCPALDKKLIAPTVEKIKEGSLVFAYYPDNEWLEKSEFLHC